MSRITLWKPLPRWARPVPFLAALALGLASCGQAPAPLVEVPGAGPRLVRVEPGAGDPGGGHRVTLHGEGFASGQVVWLGETLITAIEPSSDGASLGFEAPPTPPGTTLDVGVGRLAADGTTPEVRAVLPGAYRSQGLSRATAAVVAATIGVLGLLGVPLFVVIAAMTCLGLFLEAQASATMGFFLNDDGRQGTGTDLFTSWLITMGESPLFMAIPLFTFAGTLMSESRAPSRIIRLCRALFGWLPGGLALVTLICCCFFTAFTGASGVTIVALGGLLFPILLRERYPERFSLGLLTTGGSLGLLFPPALPVIVYGLVARVEVQRLFVAAFFPGVLLVLFLFVTSFVVALAARVPLHRFSARELGLSLVGAIWELPLPFIVVGGIYLGILTASEAAAVTAFYVLVTTVLIHRDVAPRQLIAVVRRTGVLVGALLMIIGTALGFTTWLTLVQVPQQILGFMQGFIQDPLTFLITLNLFLLVVGCLMDIFSATLVVVPLITPIAAEYGVDPYHLAVVFLVNLEIGYSTPPVGINLFIAALRFRRPVFELYRASVLFIGVLLAALLLLTYVPGLTLGVFEGLPAVAIEGEVEEVVVRPGSPRTFEAVVSAGGVTLAQARERQATALTALQAEEERLGADYFALDEAVKAAEKRFNEASTREAAAAAAAALDEARAARAPLEAVAAGFEEAKQVVLDLTEMERGLRWRSRLDGTERTGGTFPAAALRTPGVHILTATARDKRGHVTQTSIRVRVEGGAAPPVDPRPPGPTDPRPQGEQGGFDDPDLWGNGEGEPPGEGGFDDPGLWGPPDEGPGQPGGDGAGSSGGPSGGYDDPGLWGPGGGAGDGATPPAGGPGAEPDGAYDDPDLWKDGGQ